MRGLVKRAFNAVCLLLVFPRVLCFWVVSRAVGADVALEGAMQSLARIPGIRGQYLRRAFLQMIGVRCHPTATLCFGVILSKLGVVLERNVYVGPNSHLGLVHLEENVLVAAGVHIPSGGRIHGFDDPDVPIREQQGSPSCVRVGAGTWIGSGAVILADVGRNSVIGAGSVVTKPVGDEVIAGGVPAREIRSRRADC